MKNVHESVRMVFIFLLLLGSSAATAADLTLGQRQGPPSPPGFANADDISELLAYRLPTWGYHTWSVGLGLNASQTGQDGRKNHSFSLSTAPRAYHESEDWTWFAAVALRGSSSNQASDSGARSQKNLSNDGRFTGNMNYFVLGDLSIAGGLETYYTYRESRTEIDGEAEWQYGRSSRFAPELGLAYGRMRDVTPLLRAQRIKERLVALGRSDLAAGDVQDLAAVIARRSGYTAVFARQDKVFWGDVLSRLAAGEALTPYEVLFLTEVMVEQLGTRRQGWQVGANVATGRYGGDRSGRTDVLEADAGWSHNLSLDHQLSANAMASRNWQESRTTTRISLGLAYLWVVADRIVWTNNLVGFYNEREQDDWPGDTILFQHNRSLNLRSEFEFYLEDTLRLTPAITARVYDNGDAPSPDGTYSWQFSVSFTWYPSRALS